MSRLKAPKPGCGVRALYHYYRRSRAMPAADALRMARYHESPEKLAFWGVPAADAAASAPNPQPPASNESPARGGRQG